MISRSTQSTIILCERNLFHHHHHPMMMKREVWGLRRVHSQIILEDQKRKTWNIWFPEGFGVEVK